MGNAPDNLSYLLVNADASLPNARTLIAVSGSGIKVTDTGAGSNYLLDADLSLKAIQALNTTGMLSRTGLNTYATRTIQSSSLSITNGDGVSGNPQIEIVNNISTQRIQGRYFGTLIGTRPSINFLDGSGAKFTVQDNGTLDTIDVTVSALGDNVAPSGIKYIVGVFDAALPNSQGLNTLGVGLLKNQGNVGMLSIAVPGVDYQDASANLTSLASLSPALGNLIVGNGTSYKTLSVGPSGTVPTSTGTDIVWSSGGGSGAPTNATYILQTTNPFLSNAQVLGSLTSGIVKNTTSTGVLSIAAAGTDYLAPSPNLTSIAGTTNAVGSVLLGTGSGYTALPIGATSGYVFTTNGTTASWQPASGGGGGAPTTSKYILQQADASLPNAQSLGALSTGLVLNTTTTGVLSIATAGTDYYSPANPTTLRETANNLLYGNGTGVSISGATGNVVVGVAAFASAVNGSNCTIMGFRAYNAFTGNTGRNTAVGHRAGENVTGTDNNVLMGYLAGQNLASGGIQNVYIGSNIMTGAFGLMSSVAIGYNIQTTSNGTNAIAIGAGLTITNSHTTQIGNNAYCGIGVQNPVYPLDIGNLTVSSVNQPAAVHLARTSGNPASPTNGGVLFFNSSDQPKFRNINNIYTLWGSSVSSTVGGIPYGTSTDGIFNNLSIGSNMMVVTSNGTNPGYSFPNVMMYQATLGTGSTSTSPGAIGSIAFTPDTALMSLLQTGFNANAGTLLFDFTMQFQMSMGLVNTSETVQFVISSNAVAANFAAGKGTLFTPTAFAGWSVTQVNCPVQLVDIVNASNTTFALSWKNNASLATLNRNLAGSVVPVYLLPNGFL
jgi:hypothetical protein